VKISSGQVRAALEAYVKTRGQRSSQPPHATPSVAPSRVDGLHHRLNEMPDERDTLVRELRTKVRHGRYYVSSRRIVDALLGRLTADLLEE
jgi:anti-sigma28 factor (negative regulator of flagellin synthesis)